MDEKKISYILQILHQVWWPVSITYQSRQITWISEKLIDYHRSKLDYLLQKHVSFSENYSISDIYSLYMCLHFVVMDLWVDEFETVIWQDFFSSWLQLLMEIKRYWLEWI